jgi:polyisoprenoid-binding protein YceI
MKTHNTFLLLGALSLSASAFACSKDDTKAKATVEEAKATPATSAATTAKREQLLVTQDAGKVGFVGRKVTGQHEGKFQKFTGTLDLDAAAPEKSKIALDIDLASAKTDDPKLDTHLASPDFFDAAKFAKATFESTEIKVGGANGATHTVTGNLDFHGAKKSLTFPVTVAVTPEKVTVKGDFTLNRKDFGVTFPGMPDNLIKDDVTVAIDLSIPRKK